MSGSYKCSYLKCDLKRTKKSPGVSFYKFPENTKNFINWLNSCQNPSLLKHSPEVLRQYYKVCSNHFHYLDFVNPLTTKPVLKHNAIPLPNEHHNFWVSKMIGNTYIYSEEPDFTLSVEIKQEYGFSPHISLEDRDASARDGPPPNRFSPPLGSPPLSPTEGAQRQKDLVSPQRLMNIMENSCPLIRPISPASSDHEDETQDDVGFTSLIPEVTMTMPHSPHHQTHSNSSFSSASSSSSSSSSPHKGRGDKSTPLPAGEGTPQVTMVTSGKNILGDGATSGSMVTVTSGNAINMASSGITAVSMASSGIPTVTMTTSGTTSAVTTVTTTTICGFTTSMTTSTTSKGMTAKSFSDTYLPVINNNKRTMDALGSEEVDGNSTNEDARSSPSASSSSISGPRKKRGRGRPRTRAIHRRNSDNEDDAQTVIGTARKYKKILPKSETGNGEVPPIHTSSSICREKDGTEEVVINLSGLNIQKLEKTPQGTPAAQTTCLYLDNNLIQTLPTIDSYKRLTKLSLANNTIDSLIWFGKVSSLRVLNLSGNKLTDAEGLWKMPHLTHVNLSANQIEVIGGHSSDPKSNLEFLDLSNNKIHSVEDFSMVVHLKELLLHRNQIRTLHHTHRKRCLPSSLEKLTLSENAIINLADVAELASLEHLKELSLKQNHCVNVLQLVDSQNNPVGPPRSFDYRPYVLTHCLNLTTLDDRQVEEHERVKAGWLISEGKLTDPSMAKHPALVTYLSEVCPVSWSANIIPRHRQLTSIPLSKALTKGSSSTPQFSVVKFALPSNNNTSSGKTLSDNTMQSISSVKKVFFPRSPSCSANGPCKHYIELIEEKAKNHKLNRNSEALETRIEELMQRVQTLESTLAESGFNLDDLSIKIEVEEDTTDATDQ